MGHTLYVRDIPDKLHDFLKEKAKSEGKSVSTFVRDELEKRRKIQTREVFLMSLKLGGAISGTLDTVALIRENREGR
ncbi:FitA-like ribbon-helix-helix domain-containing protein [Mobiluncus porci]|uniref:Antitoxin FitA-like ribbon-helix-helix domain-containing protein n=1 Tax=Mobiluncus porci TaxID=2652278 RepID=A0A7K0K4P9_9ACTO|nr:hypothetical protein [Mobiluncus porci]MST50453.1 hypothetical protein [Mobiluncus porci]